MPHDDGDLRERIVDAALELAERRSWEAVRLHEIAALLDISLDDVRRHFAEKEDVAEAWFDRADRAMLEHAQRPAFLEQPSRDRLQSLVMTWLEALATHRRVTRQIIFGKLEPGHLHVQVPGLLRVSRTVQWMREAAHRDARYLRRALEESALTSIYLATFFYWMQDDSPRSARTARFLANSLAVAERLEGLLFRQSSPTPRAASGSAASGDKPRAAPPGPALSPGPPSRAAPHGPRPVEPGALGPGP